VVPAAMKLADLEDECGRPYTEAIRDFEATTKRLGAAKKRVRNLRKQEQAITKKVVGLEKRSGKARKTLDELEENRRELTAYGLKPSHLKTIKGFLSEIRRLGGNPRRAVKILEETASLEGKLVESADQLAQLRRLDEEERQTHRTKIAEFELAEEALTRTIESKQDTLHRLRDEESKLKERIQVLTRRRIALSQQVDGLLRTQASMLGVQPDIDLVAETLPIRKKELRQLGQEKERDKALVAVAKALPKLFAKQPYSRKAIVHWLQLTEDDAPHSGFDEFTRQTIVGLMTEQGFVSTTTHKIAEMQADREISTANNKTKIWMGIARKRLDALRDCQNQMKAVHEAKEKNRDRQLEKRAANLLYEIFSRV
ncbi:MAG: hypothetical protein JSW53_03915, partial [Candidatus Bathyarchaeota archaeon]